MKNTHRTEEEQKRWDKAYDDAMDRSNGHRPSSQCLKPTTPRTDAEHAKTLTPAYEHEGAEGEAWEWARKLEKELIEALARPKEPLPFSKLF